jgi:hypothetical protein
VDVVTQVQQYRNRPAPALLVPADPARGVPQQGGLPTARRLALSRKSEMERRSVDSEIMSASRSPRIWFGALTARLTSMNTSSRSGV